VRLYGPDLQRLRTLGDEVRQILAQTPNVIHTRAELSEALPKLALAVDEEQARLAGLDHTMIARQLNSALEGAVGGSVLEATEELPVRVRVSAIDRGQLDRVASIDLMPAGADPSATTDYQGVPLSVLAQINLEPEIATIPRFNGRRMNEVQAFITAGVLPAEVLSNLEARLAADFELPPGYSFEFGGEAAKRDEAIGNLMASVSVLLVLMVATLVLSFRSFRMAAVVGSVAALSVGLGFGALWVFGYPFGFMAIVGTMGLIGVSINDAIVVLAALRGDPRARQGEPQAVRDVVVRSTRHVVATSLTTMAGFTPLLLSGGGFWPPLAVSIAGGVGGATILALFYVPAAYILVMCRGRCAESLDDGLAPLETAVATKSPTPALATA
jgi:multidrug efflux pump subunit AcrB